MTQFMNPTWLWGLTGLLVPLSIHLLSRKQGKTIYIGSIRHLRDSNTARFSSIRLNEILLLSLRCLLLILIVMLLAGIQFNVNRIAKVKWLVIEKGIEKNQAISSVIDSLEQQGYNTRYLAAGFPDLKDSLKIIPRDSYWGLAEELSRSADSAVVISYNYASLFKGKRLIRPGQIRWITLDPGSGRFPVKAVVLSNDSVWSREVVTSAQQTSFETKRISSGAVSESTVVGKLDSITITIFNDAEFDYDKKIISAILSSIQTIIPYKLIVSSKPSDDYNGDTADWIIWLSNQAVDIKSANSIGYKQCNTALPLLVPGPDARLTCREPHTFAWVITKRLNEGSALKDNLNVNLASILLKNYTDPIGVDKDKRVLPESMMWSSSKEASPVELKTATSSIDQYVVIALLLVLIAERLVAYKRNQ